ncbi:MAG TPA: acyl-CoA dehydrogenase family protein [Solirubrobacteraceae bacterium]
MAQAATTAAPGLAEFREHVRAIVRERVAPRAAAIEADGEYPWDIRELFAAQDLLALPGAASTLSVNVAIEEIARACASSAEILRLQDLGTLPIRLFGGDKQKQQWLPRCASGEWAPAFALGEPADATAVRDGDWWVLNGTKRDVANAGVADLYVVFAGDAAFVVEADRPGLTITAASPKPGIRGTPAGTLQLQDVRVPGEHRLGDGPEVARATLQRARLGAAALAVGIAQGALDASARETSAEVAAARELLYGACTLADNDDPALGEQSAKAQLFACELAVDVTAAAERRLRDAAQALSA